VGILVEFAIVLAEDEWREDAALITDLLSAAVRRNVRYLRAHPECPSPFAMDDEGRFLYTYRVEDSKLPKERFSTIEEIIDNGGGDCDKLVPWVVAFRIVRGGDTKARCILIWKRGPASQTIHYHVQEFRSIDGAVGDPCRTLGM
jgi:hypothetical protein